MKNRIIENTNQLNDASFSELDKLNFHLRRTIAITPEKPAFEAIEISVYNDEDDSIEIEDKIIQMKFRDFILSFKESEVGDCGMFKVIYK